MYTGTLTKGGCSQTIYLSISNQNQNLVKDTQSTIDADINNILQEGHQMFGVVLILNYLDLIYVDIFFGAISLVHGRYPKCLAVS